MSESTVLTMGLSMGMAAVSVCGVKRKPAVFYFFRLPDIIMIIVLKRQAESEAVLPLQSFGWSQGGGKPP